MKRLHEILNPSLTDDVRENIVEVLTKDSTAKDWIDDFIKSDAPQFKGKDKEERIKMALGAYYAAQRNEDITFDDLSIVDPTDNSYPEDEEGIIARQYIKSKRGVIGEESDDDLQEEILGEALTMMQRIKRRSIMRKNKGKIALGRKRASMRRASNTVLKARALRAARNMLFKKLLRKDKADASYGEKVRAEKVLATRRGAIERIARKILPAMRKKEMEKFSKKNES